MSRVWCLSTARRSCASFFVGLIETSTDDVKHVDVIGSIYSRQRYYTTADFQVKSHRGLLMNEIADVLAAEGRVSDDTRCITCGQ